MIISEGIDAKKIRIPGYRQIIVLEFILNFIFYGFKSYLVLYLVNRMGLAAEDAISLFTAFLSMSYITSFIGSYIADHWIGRPEMVAVSLVMCCVGLLSVISDHFVAMIIGIAMISFGAGAAKPILAALLASASEQLPPAEQERRFKIFYMSLNAGALVGPILASAVQSYLGWSAGLIVMSVSIFGVFFAMNPLLKSPMFSLEAPKRTGLAVATMLASILALSMALYGHANLKHILAVIIPGSLAYLGYLFYKAEAHEKGAIAQLIAYIGAFTFFVLLFEQAGSSIMMFFDQAVDRSLGGWTIYPPMMLSMNPVFVVFLGYLSTRSTRLDLLSALTVAQKLALGFVFVGLGFAMLTAGALLTTEKVALIWVVLSIFLTAQGELLIAPVTMACISDLSPKKHMSTMMTFWLMALAYGVFGAGFVALLAVPAQGLSTIDQLRSYAQFFGNMACFSWGASVIFLASSWIYRRVTAH